MHTVLIQLLLDCQDVSSLGSTPVKRFCLWAGGLLECTLYSFSVKACECESVCMWMGGCVQQSHVVIFGQHTCQDVSSLDYLSVHCTHSVLLERKPVNV